ncbi:MAG TPA: type II toxin-antitoxin system Phd/YefM family antitoxin [Steroidobacteraceae bacterium]|nr:type II toxin-antitoxin system Phd/YefM family antitoxin [Steroidobacteraceae bacterium]
MVISELEPGMDGTETSWAVVDAKARFSELIDRAMSNGPQVITRNGQKAVVVVAADEWERKCRRIGNLAEFFAASPLRNSDLVLERDKNIPSPLDL